MAVLTMNTRDRRWWATLRRPIAWLLWLALVCSNAPGASTPTAPSAEYQLKSVFLYNFAQFVEWPATAFREPTSPLVIGILGVDPFGAYLDDLVRDEKIGERPLLVRRYKHGEDFTECHMLFICRSEARDLEKILTRVKGRHLLTLSDMDNFAPRGGMVRFAMENGRVQLRINLEAAKASALTISSKLLKPATIVAPGKD